MEQLAQAIKERRLVVFAGAGVSTDAGLPDWQELGNQLYQRLSYKLMEDDKDIAKRLLTNKTDIPTGIDFLCDHNISRLDIGNELRVILTPSRESAIHTALKRLHLLGIITTNYDRLMDKVVSDNAFRLTNSTEKLKSVANAINTSIINPNLQLLLKLHGDIDDLCSPNEIEIARGGPFMVLSRSDYSSLIQGERGDILRLALHAVLQRSSILFLGYSFGDPDITANLKFLTNYCKFHNPSWFVGIEGSSIPRLPEGITAITPIKKWSELADWLAKFETSQRLTVKSYEARTFSSNEKRELQILAEYLDGLESEDLCEKTIASILVDKLIGHEQVSKDWIVNFISEFLEVGHEWATTFAKASIRQLVDLKIIEEDNERNIFKVVKTRVGILHERAEGEYNEEHELFLESVRDRMRGPGITLPDTFMNQLDEVAQDICMNFGRDMAEWINLGTGRDVGVAVREIVPRYFKESEQQRIATELFEFVFDSPIDKEIPYLYRLISSAFLLNSIKLDPSASKFLKESIAKYEIYLDSNIILPWIVREHVNHKWISNIINASKEAGTALFSIEDIVEEVIGHREVAREIYKEYRGDIEALSIYVDLNGPQRANCFIQGYLNALNNKSINWPTYINNYTDTKIFDALTKEGISRTKVSIEAKERETYEEILKTIRSLRKSDPSRFDKLNIDEAKQFYQIYKRRKEISLDGLEGNVWFLSHETVFEKIYQTNPSRWGKSPTIPLSAWASFLEAHLLFEHSNRKNMLTAILKGNSRARSLPDPVALVRKKAFGNRILSKWEHDALQIAVTDGTIFNKFESAKKAITSRIQRAEAIPDYKEISDNIVAEINSVLTEKIVALQKKIEAHSGSSSDEVNKLKREIEELKVRLKKRERYKKKLNHKK